MPVDSATLAWGAAAAMLVIAVGAGLGDRARKKRADLDRIGWVDWPTLQIAALGLAFLLASIALHV